MKFKVISCNVFQRELEYCAGRTDAELSLEFLELGEHAHPTQLREKLQAGIDAVAAAPPQFDAVLLGYGLCGRAADGLTARRERLVIPRSHDCCGILLGSRKKFEHYFRDMPSTPFSSPGYVEHGDYFFRDGEMMFGDGYDALVEQYGEDNAKYIYEAMHPTLDGQLQPIYYLETPGFLFPELRERCREHAVAEGREFKLLPGDLRLLQMLLDGNWPAAEFLVLNPGETVHMRGDWDRIFTAQ